ncbi:hypothetical protein WJX75_006557 [Coccomyxa subellipsoidea]|uniref:Uncharacterized protein n=1 Tax=Coccomyxa subellipsoidea TaxID=248742 RepID=A0ABR2YRZ6_9CHLO
MHRRSCSRTDRISQCSSVDICPKANETSSEAESVSSESFEDDITPKRPPKEWQKELGRRQWGLLTLAAVISDRLFVWMDWITRMAYSE